jgi:ketosteroid isomerase-like protein
MMSEQSDDNNREILDLHERWAEAELRADVETLDSLLDGSFLAVGPLGFVLTKEQWLDRHKTGDLKYSAFESTDAGVRRYGDAAIIVAVQSQKATYRGNPVPGDKFRVTLIVVRQNSAWLIAGIHLSPIAQPPSP